MRLDGLTAGRRMSATCSTGPQQTSFASTVHPHDADYRMSWWGLRFTTGMTTLTIKGECAHQLDIYLNGVLNTTQAASASFTKNITLSGYTDGDIILIDIYTNGNVLSTARYVIWEMYGAPVVTAATWPGVPSFSGTYNAARFNQIIDAATYIWERVTAIPILPFVSAIYADATHKVETHIMFTGAVGRYYTGAGGEIVRVIGYVKGGNTAEHYEVYYNGSLAYTSATFTVNEVVSIYVPLTLSHTAGTRAAVEVFAVVTDASNQDGHNTQNSLYTLQMIRSEASASGYATAAPPTAFTAEESISAATLNSRLNAIATMLSNAKARLDARPEQWNRAQAFRRVYAADEHHILRNHKRHAAVLQRQGDTLIVRGKGIKVGWGALTVDPPGETNGTPNPVDYGKFHWANEVSVGADAKVETKSNSFGYLRGVAHGNALLHLVGGWICLCSGVSELGCQSAIKDA